MNLTDAVKRMAERHHAVIRRCAEDAPAIASQTAPASADAADAADAAPGPETALPLRKAVRQYDLEKQAREERYRARYDAVKNLQAAGIPQREIGQRMGLARNTVAKLLNAPDYPGVPSRGTS